ncbi:MAG: tripartite tricarboxylate transporter substrate-binding protein [Burkholderiales bacterium]
MATGLHHTTKKICATLSGLVAALCFTAPLTAHAWEPAKPVELIVPAGTGGGADQMARFLQGLVTKHSLMKQPLIVVNKAGGAGGEGFLDMKSSKGNPHKIIITLSNLFTTPLATGIPFSWTDLTPVSMLALDQFILWVNADSPYKTAKEYLDAVKAGPDNTFKMAGTGSKQEDQIITVAMEKVVGKKMIYIPFKGGGDVAVQLVGGHVNSTVNNPIEAVAHWRADKLRALCVFDDKRMPFNKKVTASQSWADVPTCKESGVDVDYQMLRGIFMAGGVMPEQTAYYVDVFKKMRALPEWQEFIETGAFDNTFMVGNEYTAWLKKAEAVHQGLMKEAGFLAAK